MRRGWYVGLLLSLVASAQDTDRGHSVAPIVGYEPTYQFVAGGAYFYKGDALSLSVVANTNAAQVYQLHSVSLYDFESGYAQFRTGTIQGFQPYYGEGGDTEAKDFRQLWGMHSQSRLEWAYRVQKNLALGVLGNFRTCTEVESGNPRPKDTTITGGVFVKLDTRDNTLSPREGYLFRTEVTAAHSFAQVESDFAVYYGFLKSHTKELVLALQVAGGTTLGTPTYMYKFSLGGAGKLRGFHENRFRGSSYYLQQTELRFPIFKVLSGAAFVGVGDATDNGFTHPKVGYGAGIRIGLPPDWVGKVRIDFGAGHDQHGVFAEFGHAF